MSADAWGAIPEGWGDRPLLVVGTGPSLKGFDLSRLAGLGARVLAVKESVWDLPFADACFGLDLPWMRRQGDRLETLARAGLVPVYLAVPDQRPPVERYSPSATYLVRLRTAQGLSERRDAVESGTNSGFGALNFAVSTGARLVYLLGYDYRGDPYCPERYAHHPRGHNARYMRAWGGQFGPVVPQLARLGATVINASLLSTIDAFPKISLEDACEHLARVRREGSGSLRGGPALGGAPPDDAHPDPRASALEAP